ncbi:MAG: phosphotransferase [Ilumatobacter sp.]|uniref:phosphotransferase family protein n=1 Tax=Ilumatobacter sp. TaxID=1967498 RepID=UPI003752032E|nr:phosphotransferase [Ilumatobacter sp.]
MLGSLIAVGRTSQVFRYGNDAVAKVLGHRVPDHWASVEASLTASVRALGVPAPEVLDITAVDGRPAVIFELIEGPTMWQLMLDDRAAVGSLVHQFAEVQRSIHRAGVPDLVPASVERMGRKIAQVDVVSETDRRRATDVVQQLPRGAALLHGDLHPGNILVGPGGLVAIDWFDASVGHPAADVVRSRLLIGADMLTDRRHLPGATDADLQVMQDAYLVEMSDVLEEASDHLDDWIAATALSRIAEGTADDVEALASRWRDHNAHFDCTVGEDPSAVSC